MEKVILIRRSSPDCYSFSSKYFQLHYFFPKLRTVWDKTFNISYFDYREKVHEIQKENLEDIVAQSNCTVMYLYELENIEQLAGKLVLPVDDDDWFVDNIFDELEEFKTSNNYSCRWLSWKLNIDNHTSCPITFPQNHFEFHYLSNNYALKSPIDDYHFVSHASINNYYIKELFTETYINKHLSLHNVHLGSISLLNKIIIKENSKLALSNVLRKFKNTPVTLTYFDKLIVKLFDVYKTMDVVLKPFC